MHGNSQILNRKGQNTYSKKRIKRNGKDKFWYAIKCVGGNGQQVWSRSGDFGLRSCDKEFITRSYCLCQGKVACTHGACEKKHSMLLKWRMDTNRKSSLSKILACLFVEWSLRKQKQHWWWCRTIKVVAYAESFGGVSPMPEFLIDFIVNWKVESYRSKVSLAKK